MTDPARSGPPAMHDLAARGFSVAADAYERSRPDYPADAVAQLVERLDLRPGRTVLDIGAGTGKLTRLLTASGARVIALEPLDAMRAKLPATAPAAEALTGTAEAIPLPEAAVDAAVCAQAFHWFDAPRALADVHRVLRPGGWLVLIWNVRDESVPWVEAMGELVGSLQEQIPRHQDEAWRPAVDASSAFAFAATTLVPHGQTLTPAGVLDRLASMSVVAAAAPDVRERLLADVAEILRTDPATAGREEIVLPYTTELHWLRRLDGPTPIPEGTTDGDAR
jgi:SAM-dependent methyltransferase